MNDVVDPFREEEGAISKQGYELYSSEVVRCLALGSLGAGACPIEVTTQEMLARGYNFFQNVYFHRDFIFVTSSKEHSAVNLSAWALFSDDESIQEWRSRQVCNGGRARFRAQNC